MVECEEDKKGVWKEVWKNLKRNKIEVVKEVWMEFQWETDSAAEVQFRT